MPHRALLLLALLPLTLIVLACSDSTSNCADCGDGDLDASDGDLPDGDTDGGDSDGDIMDGDADADMDTPPQPVIDIRAFDLPEQSALASGADYDTPSFVYDEIAVDPSYTHIMTFSLGPMMPPWRKAMKTPGPLVLYSDAFDCIVVSTVDYSFSALVWFEDNTVKLGLSGETTTLDADASHRFLLVTGKGIGATIQAWGEQMLELTGKTPKDRYADPGLSYLGYWTDNGAYYYYKTEDDMNEEDTLLAVRDEANERKIPYGYMQLDSWWYYKENMGSLSPGGLIRWEPVTEMFPDGLTGFQQKLGWPLMFHNRWFAEQNDYLDDYDFIQGDGILLPADRAIYDHFMADVASWGGFTYEQDWLVRQFEDVPALRQSLSAGPQWMSNMDAAATDAGLTMQLCMASAPHVLDSIKRQSPTTVRTSIDYAADVCKACYWPHFHIVNMIAGALGLWPFKDNFHSSEKRGQAEALISSLSAGMVGVGDRIGLAERDIIMATCRADGLLLKPDRPAVPIDPMFLPHTRPFTTVTQSARAELSKRWLYVAAYNLARNHPERESLDQVWATLQYDGKDLGDMFVWPDLVDDWGVDLARDFDIDAPVVWYDWRSQRAEVVDATTQWTPVDGLADFAYAVLVPILDNGLALVGEPDKYVTLADKRFASIAITADGLEIELIGAPQERVTLRVFDTRSDVMLPDKTISLSENGTGHVTINR